MVRGGQCQVQIHGKKIEEVLLDYTVAVRRTVALDLDVLAHKDFESIG